LDLGGRSIAVQAEAYINYRTRRSAACPAPRPPPARSSTPRSRCTRV